MTNSSTKSPIGDLELVELHLEQAEVMVTFVFVLLLLLFS
jgi:hypothetical protein